MIYLSNAFSLQMLNLSQENNLTITPLKVGEVKEMLSGTFINSIGHTDTANVLSNELGFYIDSNRINISLTNNDILIVAQLTGGRLPEGSTTLPDGFEFKFAKVTVTRP
jgi:hypothetical protein